MPRSGLGGAAGCFRCSGGDAPGTAAARHLVWTLALSGALVIPLLGSVLPAWPVLPLSVFNAPTIAMSTSGGVSLLASWETMAVPSAQQELHTSPTVQGSTAVHHEPLDWRWIAAMLWAAGALVLALRLLVGVARVRWLGRRALARRRCGLAAAGARTRASLWSCPAGHAAPERTARRCQ